VYEKGLNRKRKKQIQIIDPLKNLSYNYNNKASTHRCPCFAYGDEINRRVKKEVNILFQRLLEYNEKTFDKFMQEITIEHEKR
ncbi:11489_t:CDS:2, partial [Dentiscutata erythropus]